ncbi:hypothetical protein L1277_000418 [Okibacterium sp. HSC-33S16]|uniref:hypothetical protein n=1 Tax=Okibacterium sp. HSC-33S16 TaxID=2910965 RepID=UPI00209D3108|nr:hypothetical protein [Okibacterium sp. HSC-33S16]MCP2030354.1 hypothetical protein [Okibacterium sp. HSC-33S16]
MNTNPGSEHDRNAALRSELVAAVNATPYLKPRIQRRSLGAAIAAFALAGAITGGAISATALSASTTASVVDDSSVTIDISTMASSFVGTHTKLFGTPFILSGHDETVIEMGVRPEGATSIAVTFHCIDAGEFTTAFNGKIDTHMSCTHEDASASKRSSAGMSGHHGVDTDEPQTLTIRAHGSSRYMVWASWARKTPAPESSATQLAELSDGQVTREEYDAAFDRFASCMTAAGYPIASTNRTGTVIQYSLTGESVAAGADAQCYTAEFEQVDISWQIAHENTSESTEHLRRCLVAAGIEPSATSKEIVQQLKDAGIYDLCTS